MTYTEFSLKALFLLGLAVSPSVFAAEARVIETVLPALAYGAGCESRIDIRNLSDRTIAVTVESHRESGALAAFKGQDGNTFRIQPDGALKLLPHIEEETTGAWVAVRETVPTGARPAAAIQATTECVDAARVQTVQREAAYAMRNPWFAADTAEKSTGSVLFINTTAQPVTATPCYSSGNLYSVPGQALKPVCSSGSKVQVPPFGSRTFPLQERGSSRLDLRTSGDSIVLQILRPLSGSARLFEVDSTVSFEGDPTHQQ